MLVKHDDGQLELVTLYIVRRAGGEARVIDRTGATYTGAGTVLVRRRRAARPPDPLLSPLEPGDS